MGHPAADSGHRDGSRERRRQHVGPAVNYVSRGGMPSTTSGRSTASTSPTWRPPAPPIYYGFGAFGEITANTGGAGVTQQTGGVGINRHQERRSLRGSSFTIRTTAESQNITDAQRAQERDLGQSDSGHRTTASGGGRCVEGGRGSGAATASRGWCRRHQLLSADAGVSAVTANPARSRSEISDCEHRLTTLQSSNVKPRSGSSRATRRRSSAAFEKGATATPAISRRPNRRCGRPRCRTPTGPGAGRPGLAPPTVRGPVDRDRPICSTCNTHTSGTTSSSTTTKTR